MKQFDSNFWRICSSMFFFTMGFNLLIPEMNALITDLHGAAYKGLTIGLFTLSAGISRPFSGKLSDYIGRKKVMGIGVLVSIIICFSYSVAHSVFFLLLLRFLHGFCTGFYPTGATALVTDLLPDDRRGAGMGIWGTFISLGIGVGNGLSSSIVNHLGRGTLFVTAGLISLLAYYLMTRTKETLRNSTPFDIKLLVLKPSEIFETSVIPVAIVMFLSAICSGIIFVLTSDMATYLNIANKGWFFIFYVVSTISVRLFIGPYSDKFGRRETLLVGTIVLSVSMLLIGNATNLFTFTLSSILFGIATGIVSPTIFAWTADLSPPDRRGVGAGTMFIALEFGILAGSVCSSFFYDSTAKTVLQVFTIGSMTSLACVIYLIWHLLRRNQHASNGITSYSRR